MEKPHTPSLLICYKKLFLFIIALSSSLAVAQEEDYSNKILLIHASVVDAYFAEIPITQNQTPPNFPNGDNNDSGIEYTAKFLKGMLNLTEHSDLEVDFHQVTNAHSLADVFYDKKHAATRAMVGRGYKYVFFFDSEQSQVYAEIMYEACKQFSKLVLDNGGTPMLMMYRSNYLDSASLGESCYRIANGLGIEVIPAGYAYQQEGIMGSGTSDNFSENLSFTKRQAMINASAMLQTITGTRADTLNYRNSDLSAGAISRLTKLAGDTLETHKTSTHYTTSSENEGAVVYRYLDITAEPHNNNVRHLYKGASTSDFTSARISAIIKNGAYTSTSGKIAKTTGGLAAWRGADTSNKSGTLSNATNRDKTAILFATDTTPGAYAQKIKNHAGEQIIPMVYDWIKGFGNAAGNKSTVNALNSADCALHWYNYHFRGWKAIPLTVGLGRLNETFSNFRASDDATTAVIGHISDPVVYMNSSMMLATALGQEIEIPDGRVLPKRKGSWTQAQLRKAVKMGHDLVKELAYMSETFAYVPDSDLSVTFDSLPGISLGASYSQQLTATGGDGNYTWEVISKGGLPEGISLASNGVLSGTLAEEFDSWSVAFKVTDGNGAFRKVGLRLNPGPPVAIDLVADVAQSGTTVVELPTYVLDPSRVTYSIGTPSVGTASLNGNQFTFNAPADFSGEATVEYTLFVDGLSTGTSTITFTVTEILAGYDFDNGTGNPTTEATVQSTNVIASSYGVGAGLISRVDNSGNSLAEVSDAEGYDFGTANPFTFGGSRDTFGYTDMNNGNNLALAITNNDYMTFTVSPTDGHKLDLSHLTFRTLVNQLNNSAERWALFSSVDGFTEGSHIAAGRTTAVATYVNNVVDLSDAKFQELTAPVEFRLYIYGGNEQGSSATQFDKVILHGVTEKNVRIVYIRKRSASFGLHSGDGSNGGNLNIHSDLTHNNLKFKEIDRGGGYYSYERLDSEHSITSANGGKIGQNVLVWSTNPDKYNQQWQKVDAGDGSFTLRKRSALSFGIHAGGKIQNRSNVNLHSNFEHQNLHWYVIPVE